MLATPAASTMPPSALRYFAKKRYEIEWWDDWEEVWTRVALDTLRATARSWLIRTLDEDLQARAYSEEERALARVALIDHKIRHPASRGARSWVLKDLIRGRGLAVCRFCRGVLVAKISPSEASMRVTKEFEWHLIPCAITALASDKSAAPSGGVEELLTDQLR
jgi:hypothetical protein